MSEENALKTVLIIEDEQALAKALRLKLISSGYNVVVANDGKQAIEEIEKGGFHLALVDLLMPDVDGWEVLKVCKEKRLKCMVVSNLGQEEDMARAQQMGASKFIIKSETSLSEIVEIVQAELENQ